MYNMIKNLDSIKENRYRMFIANRQNTQIIKTQPQTQFQQVIRPRGQPMLTTGRRSMSMVGITGFKSSGSGCGCGS